MVVKCLLASRPLKRCISILNVSQIFRFPFFLPVSIGFFAHSFLYSILLSYRFGPVCPQRLPNIANETAALEKMPKGRLEYLRRLLPYLQNQSEDCLYLNIYVPIQGKFTFIFLLFSALFLYALMRSLNVCDLHKFQTNTYIQIKRHWSDDITHLWTHDPPALFASKWDNRCWELNSQSP